MSAAILQIPIAHDYVKPSESELATLRTKSARVVIKAEKNIFIENAYYARHVVGTASQVYTRAAVYEKLLNVAASLPEQIGLLIFDVFRTRETQKALLIEFIARAKADHPNWPAQQAEAFARQFVLDPDEIPVPAHNSGGAVDLALYDVRTGAMLDFGTEFDAIDELAFTLHFEAPFDAQSGMTKARWQTIRDNRRLLFHSMVQQGFTNYVNEWWHYDVGNVLWGKTLGITPIFGSLEDEA